MLISKFSSKINTNVGESLIFSLICDNISDVGKEFRFSDKLEEFLFYEVNTLDSWINDIQPPLMFIRDDESDLFNDVCIREETEYHFIIDYPMNKMKLLEQRRENQIFPFVNRKLKNHIAFNSKETWVEIRPNVTRMSGRINFRSFAGIAKFEFYETTKKIEVEVVSYKLNYEDDFRSLLSELAQHHSELLLSLDQPTEISLGMDELSEASPQGSIFHLRRLMENNNLPLAIETILANPHVKISHDIIMAESSLVTNPDLFEISSNPSGMKWVKGGSGSKYFRGLTPKLLPEEHLEYIHDNQENQFVKFCLEELLQFIIRLLETLPEKFQNSRSFLISSQQTIEGYLTDPFFLSIGQFRRMSNSMVMQKRNGYKDMLKLIQEFEFGLQLDSDVSEFDNVDGDLRPIHKLYEYWCFFSLFSALKSICGKQVTSELLYRTEKGFTLCLKEKNQSQVVFNYNNKEVSLYYNRDFKKYTSNLWDGSYDGGVYHPDFSVRIVNNGKVHWVHFDAKYKLDYSKFMSMIKNGEGTAESSSSHDGNYKRNDIYTAHAYKDAILGTRGVYILYPDNIEDASIFIRNPVDRYVFHMPSIGAIPLRPGSNIFNQKQQSRLKEYIQMMLDILTMDNLEYQEETGIVVKQNE